MDEIVSHEVEYATIAAEQASEKQLRELERRILQIEAEQRVSKPSKMRPEAEVLEDIQAQRAYVDERVTKGKQRRASAREALKEIK